jgi:hypothetical protein
MTRFSSWFLRVSQLETDPFEKPSRPTQRSPKKNAHETSARLWLTLIRFANRMSENLRGVSSLPVYWKSRGATTSRVGAHTATNDERLGYASLPYH